ncbi:unnamed protein product [Linum trigynum]|uniref:Uncharacterized protein n=1 Tax=Linum trigynum TaxID=586398 RepID=A0AAV2FCQ8_9ROSI
MQAKHVSMPRDISVVSIQSHRWSRNTITASKHATGNTEGLDNGGSSTIKEEESQLWLVNCPSPMMKEIEHQ